MAFETAFLFTSLGGLDSINGVVACCCVGWANNIRKLIKRRGNKWRSLLKNEGCDKEPGVETGAYEGVIVELKGRTPNIRCIRE